MSSIKNSAFGGTLAFGQHGTIRDSGAGYSPIRLDRAQIDAGNLVRVNNAVTSVCPYRWQGRHTETSGCSSAKNGE